MCIHENEEEIYEQEMKPDEPHHCCRRHCAPPPPRPRVTLGDVMLVGIFLCMLTNLVLDILDIFGCSFGSGEE